MQSKAANLTAPYRRGAPASNATPIRLFTAVAAPGRADPLPAAWLGKFVVIKNVGSNPAVFYLSDDATSTVDPTVTASNDGTSSDNTKLGYYLAAAESIQVRLPYMPITVAASSGGGNAPGGPGAPGPVNFVRASTAGTSIQVSLAEQ